MQFLPAIVGVRARSKLGHQKATLAIASAVAQGVVGGTIYDALLARCALKANATTIYTWDLNHFRLLGPEVARRAQIP
jgi:predicted nucleic acid-binding protein